MGTNLSDGIRLAREYRSPAKAERLSLDPPVSWLTSAATDAFTLQLPVRLWIVSVTEPSTALFASLLFTPISLFAWTDSVHAIRSAPWKKRNRKPAAGWSN